MKPRITLATQNPGKIKEFKELLGEDFEILTLEEIGCTEELPETGQTFEENSHQKADYIAKKYGINCLADDSGLEVEALEGAPGLYSARYAGEHGNHEANIALLLKNLNGISQRFAQFRTVISLLWEGELVQFEGFVKGSIAEEKMGQGGFGYDPIFIPNGYKQTFAQLPSTTKNEISHRGKAMQLAVEWLKKKNA